MFLFTINGNRFKNVFGNARGFGRFGSMKLFCSTEEIDSMKYNVLGKVENDSDSE